MATSSSSRPRRVPPEQALPEPAIGASQAVGAGAAAGAIGTAAGTAAGVAATAPGVALIKAGQESIEGILEALSKFFILSRAREDAWVVRTMRGKAPQADILEVIAEETARAAEFQRRVVARVRRDAAKALRQEDAERRREAIRKILAREQVYARQRSEAMAVRALAAIDRAVLRQTSPRGAYWKLDDSVKQHTADCIAMGGRFWPWEAIAVLHPPTHPGCRCSLHGEAEAIAAGWIKPEQVARIDVARAVRQALAAKALLHEGEERDMFEAVVEAGLAEPRAFIGAYMAAVA